MISYSIARMVYNVWSKKDDYWTAMFHLFTFDFLNWNEFEIYTERQTNSDMTQVVSSSHHFLIPVPFSRLSQGGETDGTIIT